MKSKALAVVNDEAKRAQLEPVESEKKKLYDQLEEQYILPWEQQRALIRSQSPLTEPGVKLALSVARSFGLPLQGVNVIPSQAGPQIYVNSDGIRWRLHTDPRGIKESSGVIEHPCTKEEPWVRAVATIILNDGSLFKNIGSVPANPANPLEVSNAEMKAVTKAKRRSGIDAVGVALPIYEDYVEWEEDQRATRQKASVEGEFKEVTVTVPTNLAELLQWITQNGHTTEEAVTVAGPLAGWVVNGVYEQLKTTWKL